MNENNSVYLRMNNLKITITEQGVQVVYPDGNIHDYDYEYFFKTKWSRSFQIVRHICHLKGWGILGKKVAEIGHFKEHPLEMFECGKCKELHTTLDSADKCHWAKVNIVELCSCHRLVKKSCPILNDTSKSTEEDHIEKSEEEDFSWLQNIDYVERKRRR